MKELSRKFDVCIPKLSAQAVVIGLTSLLQSEVQKGHLEIECEDETNDWTAIVEVDYDWGEDYQPISVKMTFNERQYHEAMLD